MQKRIWLSGAPYWIGVYNDEPGEWVIVGEVGGRLIAITGPSERDALERWRSQAAKAIGRRA